MKRTVFRLATAFLLLCWNNHSFSQEKTYDADKMRVIYNFITHDDSLKAMAHALADKESGFNDKAVSSCGRWVGCLQLAEIYVAEANRIIGSNTYSVADRYDRHKSFEMFVIIQEHHNPKMDIDRAITLHNPKCKSGYRNYVKNSFKRNLLEVKLGHNYFK